MQACLCRLVLRAYECKLLIVTLIFALLTITHTTYDGPPPHSLANARWRRLLQFSKEFSFIHVPTAATITTHHHPLAPFTQCEAGLLVVTIFFLHSGQPLRHLRGFNGCNPIHKSTSMLIVQSHREIICKNYPLRVL